jgi:regulator of replication initiation timing
MNIYIHDSLVDMERRIQEVLDELRAIREQVFYTYEPNHDEQQDDLK